MCYFSIKKKKEKQWFSHGTCGVCGNRNIAVVQSYDSHVQIIQTK